MDDILCPNCGKPVKIDQALRHQLEEKIAKEQKAKHKLEIEKARQEALAAAQKEAKKEAQKELAINQEKTKELEKKLAEIAEKNKQQEEKIKAEALKKAEEEFELKLKQKEIQLEQVRKANIDLNRKLEQGSQQLQGEALELNLEGKLRQSFPSDEFLPVPKGVEGGDIWQKVKFQGNEVGTILWEFKRTKAWSNGWLTKLKDDSAKISASESILVSQVLPTESKSFDRKEGVWLTEYAYAISICRYIRFLLTTIHSVKSKVSHTDEDWGRIRDYMMSDSFKHRMGTHFDGVKILRDDLNKEQRLTQIRWKRQEVLIDKIDSNLINFYGELKALVPSLPELDEIEALPESTDENSSSSLL